MILSGMAKNCIQVNSDLTEKLFEFIYEIQNRLRSSYVDDILWDDNVPRNLDGFSIRGVSRYENYFEFVIESYDKYDDFFEEYIIKYFDIYDNMSFNEIASYILKTSNKMKKERIVSEIKNLEDDLEILKERLNELNKIN